MGLAEEYNKKYKRDKLNNIYNHFKFFFGKLYSLFIISIIFYLLFILGNIGISLFKDFNPTFVDEVLNNSPHVYINYSVSNYLNESDIKVYDNFILINISHAFINTFAATGSMKPTIDENTWAIKVEPKSDKDLHVGDIITYKHINDKSYLEYIAHRIIRIDVDNDGIYYTAKGDNNKYEDDIKIRFQNITSKVVGLIY